MHFVCMCESSISPDSLHALNAPEECHWTEWFTLQWQVSLTGFVGLLGAISYHILYISIMHIGGGVLVGAPVNSGNMMSR